MPTEPPDLGKKPSGFVPAFPRTMPVRFEKKAIPVIAMAREIPAIAAAFLGG